MTKVEMLNRCFAENGGCFVNETVEQYAKRHTVQQIIRFCNDHANYMNNLKK